jgi:CubicO group peptidase (beta-lactamase class C family)
VKQTKNLEKYLHYSEPQQAVEALCRDLINSGKETGLQVSAYQQGRKIVDVQAGIADIHSGRVVTAKTLFPLFSCGKGVVATTIHRLAQQGKLAIDQKVAYYWPEFAQHGKETITIGDVLTHRAGVPQMPDGTSFEMICDWEWVTGEIAQLEPLWLPGTEDGYHALTYGWILGEVARRVDGRPFAQLVQEEIAQPLGMSDLYFGISDQEEELVAQLLSSPTAGNQILPDSLMNQAMPAQIAPDERWNQPEIQHACIPAAGLLATADALARHYAGLLTEGFQGVQLLSPEQLRLATAIQTEGRDRVLYNSFTRRSFGYQHGGSHPVLTSRREVFGHTGMSGAIGLADPEYGFAFALTKNQIRWHPSYHSTETRIARLLRSYLGIPE